MLFTIRCFEETHHVYIWYTKTLEDPSNYFSVAFVNTSGLPHYLFNMHARHIRNSRLNAVHMVIIQSWVSHSKNPIPEKVLSSNVQNCFVIITLNWFHGAFSTHHRSWLTSTIETRNHGVVGILPFILVKWFGTKIVYLLKRCMKRRISLKNLFVCMLSAVCHMALQAESIN